MKLSQDSYFLKSGFSNTGLNLDDSTKKPKTQDELKFDQKLEREMRLADKRVASLQEKINQTLSMHQGSFSKQFDQIATAQNAITNKSFSKLEVKSIDILYNDIASWKLRQ